jgi:hypothetical protein
MDPELSAVVSTASSDDYAQLQRRYILATLTVSAFAVAVTALFFDLHIASSVLVGALSSSLPAAFSSQRWQARQRIEEREQVSASRSRFACTCGFSFASA